MPGTSTVQQGKDLGSKLAKSVAACRAQAAAYGSCVKAVFPDVDKGACAREFEAMQKCFVLSVSGTSTASANYRACITKYVGVSRGNDSFVV